MRPGERLTRFVTVRGTKKEAQAELTRLLAAHDAGTLVEPSKLTVADYMRAWINRAETLSIAGKTAERYRALIERQIVPHLGARLLQKLRPADVAAWHSTLLRQGAVDGGPLSPRTVGHCHRVLHKALNDAARQEIVSRNVASVISAPKVADEEMMALTAEQVPYVLAALEGSVIYPHVVVLLATGMRRGELMGLRWGDVDFETGKLRIERSIEKTKAGGLKAKSPKTANGRRTISLPAAALTALRIHRKAQLELRMALGLGKLPDAAHVCGDEEGNARDPDYVTRAWRRCVASRGIPDVPLHALRHSHASALIAGKHDPVTVSRRLGHGNAAITLRVYSHMFGQGDEDAAQTIDALLGSSVK